MRGSEWMLIENLAQAEVDDEEPDDEAINFDNYVENLLQDSPSVKG